MVVHMRTGVALLLLVLMDAHVAVQVARLRESELTKLALVRLFATVHSHVLGKRRGVREGFSTVFAPSKIKNSKPVQELKLGKELYLRVRPLARVRSHVRGYRGTLRELSAAYFARERLLT